MSDFVLTYNTEQEAKDRSMDEMRRRRRGGRLLLTKYAYPILRHRTENLYGCKIQVGRNPITLQNVKPIGLTQGEFERLVVYSSKDWDRKRTILGLIKLWSVER